MSGRDANQLAADVRRGLEWMANYSLTGTEQTLHIDFQGKARELLPALDELVALVGTLQQERDALRESGQRWAENVRGKEQRIVAAEARVDEVLRVTAAAAEADTARAGAAEAALATTTEELRATTATLIETNQALATTRQALTQIEYLANVEPINPMIAHHARRALADTGGDTKEPA